MSVSDGLEDTFNTVLIRDATWKNGVPEKPLGCALIFFTDMQNAHYMYLTIQGGHDEDLRFRKPIISALQRTYAITDVIYAYQARDFDVVDATTNRLPFGVSGWEIYVKNMADAYVRHLNSNH